MPLERFDWFLSLLSAVLASVGGLYTSVVVKYTDNIMKGFSAAAAIVLSTVASVVLFGLQISECIAQSRGLLISWCIYSRGQKFTSPFYQNKRDHTKCTLFSTDLNKIFHIKDVYIHSTRENNS